jgi:hypothetical protein
MRMIKVRILDNKNHFITNNVINYCNLDFNQAVSIFFPNKYTYELVDENDEADICIVGIQHENNDLLRDNEFNIFITVENLSIGRDHYRHFNKYNKYENDKINLFYYNDVNHLIYNTIPIPLCFIRQFNNLKNSYDEILNTKFEDKQFCLAISKNFLNPNKINIIRELSKIGPIDHISAYDNLILNKSCYNSIELLKIFNRYKFIICVENSKTDNYITEKIFNVFLAKAIPIYDGAPNITNYINSSSFIKYGENYIKKIYLLLSSRGLYDRVINEPKINSGINIEEIERSLENIFDTHLKNKYIS